MISKSCEICGKEFHVKPSREKRVKARFCSMKCFGSKVKKVCVYCGEGYEVQRHKATTSKYCSQKCLSKAKESWEGYWKGKKRPNLVLPQHWKKGEEHPYWRGGVSRLDKETRHSYEYASWRKVILNRDRKCVWCGSAENLQVDHIKPFRLFPHLRFDVSNGRVLCRDCHIKTPSYGFFPKKEGFYA